MGGGTEDPLKAPLKTAKPLKFYVDVGKRW